MKARFYFYLRGLDEIRSLGGNNDGFRASYVVRNFELEEEFERLCVVLDESTEPEEIETIANQLVIMGRLMIHDIVKGLVARDHDKPVKVSGGKNDDGSRKPPFYFRSSVYEAPPYRKVIRRKLAAVAHRFGDELSDPGEHRTWRLCDADGVLADPVVTYAEWDAARQAEWEARRDANRTTEESADAPK